MTPPFFPHSPKQVPEVHQSSLFNPLTPSQITVSGIPKSSQVEPQLLHCDNKFDTLTVHPHSTLTAPSIGGIFEVRRTSAVEFFCGNSRRAKAVGYFPRKTPLQIFDRILNATLPNNLL